MAAPAEEMIYQLNLLHRRMRDLVRAMPADMLDRVPAENTNSVAVLVTHTLGSELAWLHLAAGREFKRDRESEFAARGRTADDLVRSIDEVEDTTGDLIRAALDAGIATQRERPGARPMSVGYCLTWAIAHATEHVGQAELTKQVLEARGS
jgi:uncharacterized damage-inducible protein DinB